MSDFPRSFKLSEIPANMYLSPSFLFAWWDGVIKEFGPDIVLHDQSADYKRARELWVAAIFACCKRISSEQEHWVKPVYDNAPDAIVAYFKRDRLGYGQMMYPIEVTTCGTDDRSLESVLKAKLDKAYSQETRIICYVTDLPDETEINLQDLADFVNTNNPRDYEVWLLSTVHLPETNYAVPLRLACLTTEEGYDIDYAAEKLVRNKPGDVFRVAEARSTNREGTHDFLGEITLEYPQRDSS